MLSFKIYQNALRLVVMMMLCLAAWQTGGAQGQQSADLTLIRNEKKNFLDYLTRTSIDSAIVLPVSRYAEREVTGIYSSIDKNVKLSTLEKEKAVRSLGYLLQEISRQMQKQPTTLYDIPGTLQSYKHVLDALLANQPLKPLLLPLEAERIQLLGAAFTQYNQRKVFDEQVAYKRVAASPAFIINFLETKPDFAYADSLLWQAAAYDPLKFVYYLQAHGGIQDRIRRSNNIYIRELVSLSADRNATELVPFLKPLAEGKISTAEIMQTRQDVNAFFQLMVNTLQKCKNDNDGWGMFLQPLRAGIHQKAVDFYVKPVNDLHSSPDAVRFTAVKNLRPEDLYYIITSSGEEMYTSSYLGLYKRLMENFPDQQADLLFDMVQYDNFRTFMRLAANYNVLPNFLHSMPGDRMQVLITRFMGGVDNSTSNGLETAMDIADSFISLGSDEGISGLIENELQKNLQRCRSNFDFLGMRLYNILDQVFDAARKDHSMEKLSAKLGDYEWLKRQDLRNKSGEIVQLVLFYGDEDGVASFNNFLKQYADAAKWQITKTPNWVSIHSLSGDPVLIYANMPLESKDELDLRAQDSLVMYMQEQSLQPTVLVHRGHSYHLDNTLKRLTPNVRLAILGSCGGYNKAISIATISPDVQIIGSKKTGAKSVNDPIIEAINEMLVSGQDIHWPDLWAQLEARFSKSEATLLLFSEYFPPNNNPSLFVLKLFNYYTKYA